MDDIFSNMFSFEGRIRRRTYWIISLIVGFVFALADTLYQANPNTINSLIYIVVCVAYIWAVAATGAKRCHDLGHNGWWQLIPFYSLWLCFQDSNPGPNEYGENPKGE